MAVGVQLNIDGDLLQGFEWGQITVDWVIHKILWELKESELGLRIEALRRGRDSFLLCIFLTASDAVCDARGRQRMRPCGPVWTLPHELAYIDLP